MTVRIGNLHNSDLWDSKIEDYNNGENVDNDRYSDTYGHYDDGGDLPICPNRGAGDVVLLQSWFRLRLVANKRRSRQRANDTWSCLHSFPKILYLV